MIESYVRLHSPRLTGYDRAIFPRIFDIFLFEHCYAAVAARTGRRLNRKAGNE